MQITKVSDSIAKRVKNACLENTGGFVKVNPTATKPTVVFRFVTGSILVVGGSSCNRSSCFWLASLELAVARWDHCYHKQNTSKNTK